MQNAEWITLFRQLPVEIHPQVVLMLQNRTELTIETMLRIEPSYLLIRGRTAGTTEGGLPFLIPYDQITSLYLFRQIKESEVENIFGTGKAPVKKAPSNQGTAPPPALAEPATPHPPPDVMPVSMPAFGRPSEATAVARNNLLERLRAARQAAQPNK